jgi:signal recognition particle subunit SRP54
MAHKMRTASFTLEDFRKQLQQLKKMGPLAQVLDMAGFGQAMAQVDPEEVNRQLKVFEAIINSMTPTERSKPQVLNANRRKRIAGGSGTTVQDVNQLIKQFQGAQQMMKKLSKQKLPGNLKGLFR